jgi:anhydro-N-acetylmuramic acid kinase
MKEYTVIGLMSGTSLDGLDLACCNFKEEDGNWSFKVIRAETISYSRKWLELLNDAYQKEIHDLNEIDLKFGHHLAEASLDFIKNLGLKPDFIASHGHTIFHKPEQGITLQIGNGEAMSKILGLPVIYDFRSLDISLGGQGAPLVPIGDKLLFNHYDFCVNLGGFANTSYDLKGERFAQDISPVNMILNNLSQRIGLVYDRNGELASKGNLNTKLLKALNELPFYGMDAPKSLSREWFEYEFLPIVDKFNIEIPDLLSTVTEHIAIQIGTSLKIKTKGSALITGGGAHNTYLINRIQAHTNIKLVIPGNELIDFKEAIVFAFLGVLRMRNEVNCLSSATGANEDCSGGRIAYP